MFSYLKITAPYRFYQYLVKYLKNSCSIGCIVFFTSKSVIYKKQFGFRKKHSTNHAINYSINKIIDELQTRNHVIGIFIDLSKAFDTIDHNKLVSKLEHYGIRGTCLLPSTVKNLTYRPAAVYLIILNQTFALLIMACHKVLSLDPSFFSYT